MRTKKTRRATVISAFTALSVLAMLVTFVMPVYAQAPTVDGRFYGTGDLDRYYYLGSSTGGRGDLYYYLDGMTLYVAVVVDDGVNDNVFGDLSLPSDQAYVQSAGWSGTGGGGGAKHTANALISSDNMEMTLSCGDNSWTWEQDYAYDADNDQDPNEADWLSDPFCSGPGCDASGTPPPELTSSSSFVWNLNNSSWDVTEGGTRTSTSTWKSVDQNEDNDVTDEGYPTYDYPTDWHWAMVYEMSMDVTVCGDDPISIWPVQSHNSPSKDGTENVPFDPTDLLDYGDARDPSYPTLLDTDGARHYIIPGGPLLGATVDAEPDGQPSMDALGDDNDGNDDEDGVTFTTPLAPGEDASIEVTGTQGAKLDAWIDFNGDGDWNDPGEQIADSYVLSGGVDVITFPVPEGATIGATYARFRVSTDGDLEPTGLAEDGEVEDYQVTIEEASEEPEIDIEKATNGVDADDPTGPYIPVGDDVTWTYVVANPGDVTLMDVTVTDNQLPDADIDCGEGTGNIIADLEPDEVVTCQASGTAVVGQYANEATVTGEYDDTTVTDSDPSHYFGSEGGIDIEKATNGEDADTPTGPFVAVGPSDNVTWDYVVTNPGNVALSGVVVTDDNGTPSDTSDDFNPTFTGGDTDGDNELDPGETWTYEATGTAAAGQYENYAMVVGYDDGNEFSDNDPSHYYGAAPDIDIEKSTNGADADNPTGPFVPEGDPVTWEYVVTNVGNVTLTDVTVTDDQLPDADIDCGEGAGNVIADLEPDEVVTCQATGTAVVGQYANGATVTGDDPLDTTVTDDDPSHYFGVNADIDIEKSTNGEDADSPRGPEIPVGDPVTWEYVVTNPGNIPLANVMVTDDNETPLDPSDDFHPGPVLDGGYNVGDDDQDNMLDPGEAWLYRFTGTAEAGQYRNIATVTGDDPSNGEVSDDDPSHYYGQLPIGGVTLRTSVLSLVAPWIAVAALAGLLLAGSVLMWRRKAT